MAGRENFVGNAAGSVRQARALIIQQVQEMRISSSTCDEAVELLGFAQKLESLQMTLETISHRYAEPRTNGNPVRTASSPRMRG